MRIYSDSNFSQEKKKPHLIRNIFQISNVINVIPKNITRLQFRNKLKAMSETELIELNYQLFNRITNEKCTLPRGYYFESPNER